MVYDRYEYEYNIFLLCLIKFCEFFYLILFWELYFYKLWVFVCVDDKCCVVVYIGERGSGWVL